MELWLLGAGAIILIAITVWIVWPAPNRSAEEGVPMEPNLNKDVPPQGERFEDQYTAATADLSVGGVAGAVDAMKDAPPQEAVGASSTQPWSAGAPQRPLPLPPGNPPRQMSLTEPRTLGIGAGLLLTATGAAGGAWLYSRWLERRKRPINRLRRGARDLTSRISERLPETDLPEGAAPLGGVASAALISALVLARALRKDEPPEIPRQDTRRALYQLLDTTREYTAPAAAEFSRSLMHDIVDVARGQAERLPSRRELLHELADAARGGAEHVPSRRAMQRELEQLIASGRKQAHQAPARREMLRELEHLISSGQKRVDQAPGRREMLRELEQLVSSGRKRVDRVDVQKARKSAGREQKTLGIGVGGMMAAAVAGVIAWRLLRGKPPANEPWYGGVGAPGI